MENEKQDRKSFSRRWQGENEKTAAEKWLAFFLSFFVFFLMN